MAADKIHTAAESLKDARYIADIMATRALLAAGGTAVAARVAIPGAEPSIAREPRPTQCLRANFAMLVAVIGLVIAIAFSAINGRDTSTPGFTGFIACAVAFAVLVVMAWFQRSLERQILRFSAENDELKYTRERLDQENAEFDAANAKLVTANKQHEELIRQLEGDVTNLNVLYNESVNMVRQLALFGDDCKTLGHSLKEVAGDLKDTDDSLGLTADELRTQAAAISAATNALLQAAREPAGGT
jgi:hypothetical protein